MCVTMTVHEALTMVLNEKASTIAFAGSTESRIMYQASIDGLKIALEEMAVETAGKLVSGNHKNEVKNG